MIMSKRHIRVQEDALDELTILVGVWVCMLCACVTVCVCARVFEREIVIWLKQVW